MTPFFANESARISIITGVLILILDIRTEIKPFPKIAIISQKYVVSQIEFISGQNLMGESDRHLYVFFTP